MLAQDLAQRGVQQMGGRVVERGGRAPLDIDRRRHAVANAELTLRDPSQMADDPLTLFLGIGHRELAHLPGQGAAVAQLAAGLGVKGREIEDHQPVLARIQGVAGLTAVVNRHHGGALAQVIVTAELGLTLEVDGHILADAELTGGSGAPLLFVHGTLETRQVDAQTTLAGDVGRQVHGEAVGIVKLEDRLTGDAAIGEPGDGALEDAHPVGQGLRKTLLLQADHSLDLTLRGDQLRIGLAHLGHQRGDQAVKEGFVAPQPIAVTDGATHDAAQHIAAALVAGGDPVGDQEGGGAAVVGDHPQRLIGTVGTPGHRSGRVDQVDEEIDVVVAVYALDDRGQSLQAHAGIHRGARQRGQGAVGGAVELHEDQVPDLHIAVAVGVRGAGRAAGDRGTVVVEDLGTRSTGAGLTHRPEVVRGTATREAFGVGLDLLEPDIGRLVVLGEYSHPQTLGRQAQHPGQIVPGKADGLALEIVAETEVTQHLKKGVMPRGITHILQVVVLAAGAYTPLRSHRALIRATLTAKKQVLELDHARVGEQERCVIGRDQWAGGNPLVVPLGEIIEKAGAKLGTGGHGVTRMHRHGRRSVVPTKVATDQFGRKAAAFQKTATAAVVGLIGRRDRAEAPVMGLGEQLGPGVLHPLKMGVDGLIRQALITQFGTDAQGTEALARPLGDIGLRQPRLIDEALFHQPGQDRLDRLGVIATRLDLARQLQPRVLAGGEQLERQALDRRGRVGVCHLAGGGAQGSRSAAGSAGSRTSGMGASSAGLGSSCSRMRASIAFAISGFSLR